jgi:transcriptional repressor NrdR
VPITVIKHDGKRESFDPSKLLRGMVRACEKTGISLQRLERIVEEIEAQLQQRVKRETTSEEIGELVLKYLRTENEVAYIRFASVYGRFQGIAEFMETLHHLQQIPELPPIPDSPSDWSEDEKSLSTSEEMPSMVLSS